MAITCDACGDSGQDYEIVQIEIDAHGEANEVECITCQLCKHHAKIVIQLVSGVLDGWRWWQSSD